MDRSSWPSDASNGPDGPPEAKYRGVGYVLKPRGTDSPSLSRRDQKRRGGTRHVSRVGRIEVLNWGAFGVGIWIRDLEPGWGLGGVSSLAQRGGFRGPAIVHNIINGCWRILGQALKDVT